MKKFKLLLASFAMVALLSSCSHKEVMAGSDVVPGAAGTVQAKPTDNGNTLLSLSVKHLAPAGRISTNATNYIVWIQPEGSDTYQNVGALTVDKDLEGKHTTTIPYKNFKVLVTPETGAMAQAPTGPSIFEQRVMRQ